MRRRFAFNHWGIVCLLVFCLSFPVLATPVYETISSASGYSTYQTGYVEIDNLTAYPNYGKARIEWHYWQDTQNYWHYAYQIFNNDYYNTPTDFTDDYHFGWSDAGSKPDPTTYESINKFNIVLKVWQDALSMWHGPDDLYLLDTTAGSDAGGGSWGSSADLYNSGIDWTVSLGSGTPLPIDPARYNFKDAFTDGNASGDDTNGYQYFQIASTWEPGLVKANITAGVSALAGSDDLENQTDWVYGPVYEPEPVPEPATVLFLGLGFGSLILRRKQN